MIKQLKPNHFKIMNAAITIAKKIGVERTSILMIAKAMDVSHSLIYTYYPSMESIRKKIVEQALQENIIEIIFDAILNRRVNKEQLSEELKIILNEKMSGMLDNEEEKEKEIEGGNTV